MALVDQPEHFFLLLRRGNRERLLVWYVCMHKIQINTNTVVQKKHGEKVFLEMDIAFLEFVAVFGLCWQRVLIGRIDGVAKTF